MYSLGTILIFVSWTFVCSFIILFSSNTRREIFTALLNYSRNISMRAILITSWPELTYVGYPKRTILTVAVGAKGKSLRGAAIPRSLGRSCGDR
jgi:hypothetical protein